MHYEGQIIRPPSEANSILLQITVGCSHNRCTFCGTYQGERFKIKEDSLIFGDIACARDNFPFSRRLFLCDGDALIVPQRRLIPVLKEIRRELPWITRVGAYANAKSLAMKSTNELVELKENGLGILYMGLESGDDETLAGIRKGADSLKMIEMGRKAIEAGLKLSVTVLLGLAGKERSHIHAERTGKVLTGIDPTYVGALTLMLIPGTPLYGDYASGRFQLLGPMEMLRELYIMISNTHLSMGMFHANHASNYLPIKARMPKDREKVLNTIAMALEGRLSLKPEWLRAL